MYIYGKNVAKEKLKNPTDVVQVYLSSKFKDKEIEDILVSSKIKTTYLNNKIMDNKVNGLHQGIIIEVSNIKTYNLDIIKTFTNKNPIIVMLDHLEDPHNFGAIIRTSFALGISAIIIPNDRSVDITPTVVKTSAGAVYNIPIIKVPNLTNTIEKLKKEGYWIVGTDMHGNNYSELKYDMPTCLIIGNEGKGMSNIVKNNCDYLVSIPMEGEIDSLNASVSCGIILSEIKRQRRNCE
jgi:23S rRNA (guanosine2251-2'-O)-methyltransferase